MKNTKAQESGTLQSIIVSLLVMSGIAFFAVGYLNGISENYNVDLNESQYLVFQKFDEVNETLGDLSNQFISTEGEQIGDLDIITSMITSAYSVIKIVFDLPDIFFSIIVSGIQALGVPPSQSTVLAGIAVGFFLILIIFAAIALIMKVRA